MRLLLVFILFGLGFSAHGQIVDTSTFTISVFGGSDTTPPPVPSIVSVDPVASTQIDVTWGAVIDDTFLAGYVLYRDNVAIATTTLTNFSDTGLSASTTYAYSVQAFDAAGNYSATSTTVATTTPVTPPVATSTPTGGTQSGTAARAALENFSLSTTDTSALISLETAFPSRIQVRWGRSASYELGYSATDAYLRSFTTTITDLEPGTKYEYEIIGTTPRGQETVLKRGQFVTDSVTAITPPNVQSLRAVPSGLDVLLTWSLPPIDVAAVRVVRSHLGFPGAPNDGAIVYQGNGELFVDQGVFTRYSPVFYTVFVYDTAGNVSSGAVAQVAVEDDGTGVILDPTDTTADPVGGEEGVELFSPFATTSDTAAPGTTSVRIPTLEEIFIITDSESFSFATPEILIPGNQAFTVAVPVTTVSDHLKTLLVTITDPSSQDDSYSYILRLNKKGNAYEARISGFSDAGRSQFTMAIYDFETKMISRYRKQVRFGEVIRGQREVFFPDYFLNRPFQTAAGILGLLLILLFLSWVVGRKR